MNIHLLALSSASLALVVACSGEEEAEIETAAEETEMATEEAFDDAEMMAEDAEAELDGAMDDMEDAGDDMMDDMESGMMEANLSVTVSVENVEDGSGTVLGVLQTEDQFAGLEGAYTATAPADGETVELEFDSVMPGVYAVAVFQDLNDDGTTTVGDAGPEEPWGFSGEEQTGAPEFDPASIELMDDADVTITLQR